MRPRNVLDYCDVSRTPMQRDRMPGKSLVHGRQVITAKLRAVGIAYVVRAILIVEFIERRPVIKRPAKSGHAGEQQVPPAPSVKLETLFDPGDFRRAPGPALQLPAMFRAFSFDRPPVTAVELVLPGRGGRD